MRTTIQVLPAAQSSTLSYSLLAGKVFKISTLSQRPELVIEDNDERAAAEVALIFRAAAQASQPQTSVFIQEATEAKAHSPEAAAELEDCCGTCAPLPRTRLRLVWRL